jgi:hypothetical protein
LGEANETLSQKQKGWGVAQGVEYLLRVHEALGLILRERGRGRRRGEEMRGGEGRGEEREESEGGREGRKEDKKEGKEGEGEREGERKREKERKKERKKEENQLVEVRFTSSLSNSEVVSHFSTLSCSINPMTRNDHLLLTLSCLGLLHSLWMIQPFTTLFPAPTCSILFQKSKHAVAKGKGKRRNKATDLTHTGTKPQEAVNKINGNRERLRDYLHVSIIKISTALP